MDRILVRILKDKDCLKTGTPGSPSFYANDFEVFSLPGLVFLESEDQNDTA